MSKHEHIKLARALLASDDAAKLRYAALELRMAIEAIVYEKLRLYAPRLPTAVLDKWQPPQAMKALTQLEPRASRPFHLRIAQQPGPGVPGTDWKYLGEHRTFEPGWLTTNYHKLGSFLHRPSVKQAQSRNTEANAENLRSALQVVLSEVERVSKSQIDGTLATVIEFQCAACDRRVFCNEDGVRESRRATCLEASCAAEHYAAFADDGKVTFYLDATEFACLKCKHETPVENRKLAIGFEFVCEACKAVHVFAEIHWGYALKADISPQGA
jgi:hypothetical protein